MTDPIIIRGPEQSMLDETLADGGLPWAAGVESCQVFRASKAVPEITDGRGWTYHHHVDMACWRGRLYVGWNSCERDEDVWPSRELYSTSEDGREWSPPQELFPQGVSTPLRMYFYHAANGRMLAIAGMRVDRADTSEDRKGALVVREIRADHTLGDVFTLQGVAVGPKAHVSFEHCADPAFITACRALLVDRVFLEQQDRGKLLGDRRMKWHDACAWPAGHVPGDSEKWVAGKAYSFFRRRNGVIVGISKMGWTTLSRDNGETWSQPLVPPTLVTGKAKVWSERLSHNAFALVYNPSRRNRFPLVMVTSDDGVTFRDMQIIQGELPVQRYAGLHRSIGPQYVRGLSHWSSDMSRLSETSMWLVYSMNKEDIWVSRVKFPWKETGWHIYSPKWAPASVSGLEVRLEDRDPYDYAAASRLLAANRATGVTFEWCAEQSGHALHVEINGTQRPSVITAQVNTWQRHNIEFAAPRRITFRTGPYRGIGGANPIDPATDRPHEPIVFRIRDVHPINP